MDLKDIEKWDKIFEKYREEGTGNFHAAGAYREIDELRERVLDAGCGNMEYLSHIKRSENNYMVGLDPSKIALEMAKENAKKDVHLVRGVAENLPFKDNTFDNVLFIEVIHHLGSLKNCKKSLSEIYRVSKSNTLLTFHHIDYLMALKNINREQDEEGKIFFDEVGAFEILEEAGFECDNKKIFTSGDMWSVPLYRIWPLHLPPPRTKAIIQVECKKA